jgi:uncharacterized protein (TIGR03067 family)
MIRPLVGVLFLTSPLVAADPPKELHGGWKLVSVDTEAGPVDLPDNKPSLVFQGDRVLHGSQEVARLSADPAADPKVIDLKFTVPDRTYEGIYTVEKDTLKLCLNGQSAGVKERPTGFTLDGHATWKRLTFERIKPAEATPGPAFVGLVLKFDEEKREVAVESTLDDGPAKAAGLKKGDVIATIAGNTFDTLRAAVDLVRAAKPGGELTIKVRRDGKDMEVKVKPTMIPFAGLVGLE